MIIAVGALLLAALVASFLPARRASRLEDFQYFDPEFVRLFEDRGSAVRVSESLAVGIQVRLIP